MRLADIFGKGLAGAITGIDLTDLVNQGGLGGQVIGKPVMSGGLTDFLFRQGDKKGLDNFLLKPGQTFNNKPLQPYHKNYGGMHGIADFDNNYNPTFDIPGGSITSDEMQRMNKNYPIG